MRSALAGWLSPLLYLLLAFPAAQARPLQESDIRSAKRIALFVGTFEPVHEGHLGTAEAALRETGDDLAIILPNAAPFSKDAMPVEKRIEMVDAAAGASDRILYPSQGPFYDSYLKERSIGKFVERIRELNPSIRIDVVMGEEVAANPRTVITYLARIRPDGWIIGPRAQGGEREISALVPKGKTRVLRTAPKGPSSTAVRRHLAAHPELYFDPLARERHPIPHLPRQVADYILDHGVFLGQLVDNRLSAAERARRVVLKALNKSGLIEVVRSIALRLHQDRELEKVAIDGKEYPVRKVLGAGMRGAVYLIEIDGRPYALKLANPREGSREVLHRSALVQRWVAARTGIPVPGLVGVDPDGSWILQEYIHGVNLETLLSRSQPLSAELEGRLRQLVADAVQLERSSNLKLDLRADNIVIRDGIPYLVDLGPLRSSAHGAIRDYAEAERAWQVQAGMARGRASGGGAIAAHCLRAVVNAMTQGGGR